MVASPVGILCFSPIDVKTQRIYFDFFFAALFLTLRLFRIDFTLDDFRSQGLQGFDFSGFSVIGLPVDI